MISHPGQEQGLTPPYEVDAIPSQKSSFPEACAVVKETEALSAPLPESSVHFFDAWFPPRSILGLCIMYLFVIGDIYMEINLFKALSWNNIATSCLGYAYLK